MLAYTAATWHFFYDRIPHEEQLLVDFVLWLVCCRPSGKRILPDTASKYVSTVKAWHERMFKYQIGGGIDLSSLRDVIKGMNKELKLPPKRRRFGVRLRRHAAAGERED